MVAAFVLPVVTVEIPTTFKMNAYWSDRLKPLCTVLPINMRMIQSEIVILDFESAII